VVIRHLSTTAFRNLQIDRAELSPGINILHGDNAQGKTNFLEAVYFCALGRPLRAEQTRELIPLDDTKEDAVGVHVRATFGDLNPSFGFTVDAAITPQKGKYVKSIAIDRIPIKNTRELFGKVPIVSFAPEDMRLIKAGPAERRKFLDIEICQLSPVYYQELRAYHRALRQRNHLLKLAQKDKKQIESLPIWDTQLIEHGIRIKTTREKFLTQLNQQAADIHARITQNRETLTLEYKPNITDATQFAAALERHQKRDILLGSTSVGIHRDDVLFHVRGLSARAFGSQGQTRTAVLSVKLAEIALIKERLGTAPLLLLDDVFSELDAMRQRFLLEQVSDVQTLLTCTGVDAVLRKVPEGCAVLRVVNGRIGAM